MNPLEVDFFMILKKTFLFFVSLCFFSGHLYPQGSLNDQLEKASLPSKFKPEKVKELIQEKSHKGFPHQVAHHRLLLKE